MQDSLKLLKELDGKDKEAIEAVVGEYLCNEIKMNTPDSILEIGTGHGYSTCWLILGVSNYGIGEILTFDDVERPPYVWDQVFNGMPFLTKAIGKLEDNMDIVPKKVDMVFMDGDHTIDRIVKEIELLEPKLSSRAIIYIHDTEYCDGMGECLKYYFSGDDSERLKSIPVKPSSSRWIYQELKIGSGLGIAKKRGNIHAN